MRVIVLGIGGTGLLMAESVKRSGYEFIGFLDDTHRKPVLGPLASWGEYEGTYFLSSLYGAKKTPRYCGIIKDLGIPRNRFVSVIDPSAVMMTADIGAGVYVGPGVVVEPEVVLGDLCSLLGSVYVAHHCRLGEYVCCANNVSIAGGVKIGSASYIGANASIREYLEVGERAIIGMGSVVVKNVPPGAMVAGNPARSIKP